MKYITLVLGMLAFVPSLQAGVIDLSYKERIWNYHTYIHEANNGGIYANLSGLLTYQNWGTDDPSINTPTLHGFAADLNHVQFYGRYTYNIQTVNDARVEELWGRHYADLWTGSFPEQQEKVTAFSLATWELTHEQAPALNVLADTARLTSYSYQGQSGLANQWLSEIDGTGPRLEIKRLVLPLAGDWKDIYVTTGAVVPEPTTLALFAGGLLLGGLIIKRRRR